MNLSLGNIEILKNGHGGKRAGAGKPKGTRWPSSLTKEAAREALRQCVIRNMDLLVTAQIANAGGLKYLVARNAKTGKFERVTGAMLDAADAKMHERIEVWEKDPSVQAFTDLMNRALDKPAEQVQEIKLSGEITIEARLQAARKRLANAHRTD